MCTVVSVISISEVTLDSELTKVYFFLREQNIVHRKAKHSVIDSEEAREATSVNQHRHRLRSRGFGPFYVQNEVVVAKAVERGNGLGSVLLLVVVDEGEALALARDLVLGQEDAGDVAEGLEQLLQVGLLGVLGQVGHSDRSGVVV